MEKIKNPIQRKDNIVLQKLENETLLYDLKTNKAFCLNETSAMVWEFCDGNRSVSEMSREMSKQLKTLVSEDFVYLALDQLNKDGLLEHCDERNNYFAGLSRREAIRKVGFASVVALPVISSLVAPEASMAQSTCLTINTICSPGQCCAGLQCQSGDNPDTCCVGTLNNFTAGVFANVCSTAQAGCDASPTTGNCCSGTSTLSAITTSCGPGAFRCICD